MGRKEEGGYAVKPFPRIRGLAVDAGHIGHSKHTVRGLFEVDVTEPRRRIAAHKAETGETLSFTGFAISCLGQAVEMNLHMHAYRDWSLADPNRFLLIFGTPIPGYTAPENGPTEQANRRIGAAFFRVATDALANGELAIDHRGPSPSPTDTAAGARLGADLPAAAVPALVSAYAHFHGLVTLEILGQLTWLSQHPDSFYAAEVEHILDRLLR